MTLMCHARHARFSTVAPVALPVAPSPSPLVPFLLPVEVLTPFPMRRSVDDTQAEHELFCPNDGPSVQGFTEARPSCLFTQRVESPSHWRHSRSLAAHPTHAR